MQSLTTIKNKTEIIFILFQIQQNYVIAKHDLETGHIFHKLN